MRYMAGTQDLRRSPRRKKRRCRSTQGITEPRDPFLFQDDQMIRGFPTIHQSAVRVSRTITKQDFLPAIRSNPSSRRFTTGGRTRGERRRPVASSSTRHPQVTLPSSANNSRHQRNSDSISTAPAVQHESAASPVKASPLQERATNLETETVSGDLCELFDPVELSSGSTSRTLRALHPDNAHESEHKFDHVFFTGDSSIFS